MPFLEEAEIRRRMERHAAWHLHELADGPLVVMTSSAVKIAAKKSTKKATPEDPRAEWSWQADPQSAKFAPPADAEGLRTWWTDPQTVVRRVEAQIEATNFYGDTLPYHFINLGPGALAAFMGCASVLQQNTIWQEPLIEDWAAAPELVLHEDNSMWQTCQALTQASVSAAQGRWITSLTDIGGAMDISSYFRTPEKLCFDLIEHPAEVQKAEAAILKAWFQVYDRLEPLVRAYWGGTIAWNGLWHAGRTYTPQCDFSIMISPDMFRRFALPFLQRQAAALDATTYHLDGPGAIRHLDALLTVPNIRAIQWIPGDGQSRAVADWLDLYRKILDGGRNIQMHCPTPEELDLIFDQLDPDRITVWLGTGGDPEKTMARLDRLRAKRKKPR
jgi:5-methyltetrahydrofolate--homocysteine methyltransferase